jgi:hypothetical protein
MRMLHTLHSIYSNFNVPVDGVFHSNRTIKARSDETVFLIGRTACTQRQVTQKVVEVRAVMGEEHLIRKREELPRRPQHFPALHNTAVDVRASARSGIGLCERTGPSNRRAWLLNVGAKHQEETFAYVFLHACETLGILFNAIERPC